MLQQIRTEFGDVQVGTEACFDHLVRCLDDPDPATRCLAVCGLASSHDARAVDHLVRMLDDPAPEVRSRAALALGKLGERHAGPALVEAARRADPGLHQASIMALGELDSGLGVLSGALRAGDPWERVRAAVALGETRDVEAIPPLTDALLDDDAAVRVCAREALEKIRESPVF
jgi:HEAT repeat protein